VTWFKVDDGFGEHAKVDALGPDMAVGLSVWLLCGTASARSLTDGVVTRAMLARSCSMLSARERTKGAAALVRVGLWHETEAGWQFHDWHVYQPTRQSVEAERECARERMANVRSSRRVTSGEVRPKFEKCSPEHTANFNRSSDNPTRPDPSRPDPCVSEREPEARPEPDRPPAVRESEERTQVAVYVNGTQTIGDTFRKAVAAHYEAKQLPAPRECKDVGGPMWAQLARWLHEIRKQRGWTQDPHEQARRIVQAFYASTDERTVKARHDLSFLLKAPEQYMGIT